MKKILLTVIALALIMTGCKKTVESEKKGYESNLRSINSILTEYPSFESAVKEQIVLAEAAAKDAEAQADDESKIKKYGEANSLLRPAFVRNLEEIKRKMSSIKSKIIEVRGLTLEPQVQDQARYAFRDAEDALYRAERDLRSPVLNRSAADGITGLILGKLSDSLRPLENIASAAAKKVADEKKKTEQIATDKQKAETAKVEQEKPVKCPYCGALNAKTAKACKSCGAAIKK